MFFRLSFRRQESLFSSPLWLRIVFIHNLVFFVMPAEKNLRPR